MPSEWVWEVWEAIRHLQNASCPALEDPGAPLLRCAPPYQAARGAWDAAALLSQAPVAARAPGGPEGDVVSCAGGSGEEIHAALPRSLADSFCDLS